MYVSVGPPLSAVCVCVAGPMPNTSGDFWRMIWQYKVQNIVMLTKCLEAGRVGHSTQLLVV